MRKEIIFSIILILAVIILFSIFLILKQNWAQDASIQNLDFEYKEDIKNFIISPNMRDAFTQEQRQNLNIAWGEVYSEFKELSKISSQINSSNNLNKKSRFIVSKFAAISGAGQNTAQEIRSEIESPAESLDEKVASIIGTSFVLKDLAKEIKNDLSGTEFEKDSKNLYDSTQIFFEKINNFSKLFFSMLQLKNKNETINSEIVTVFNELNETKIAKFSEYDGRRFFNEIKKTVYGQKAQYGLN